MFTTKQWADKFGLNEEYVRQMCRRQIDSKSGLPLKLPAGWQAKKLGRDWIILPVAKRGKRK